MGVRGCFCGRRYRRLLEKSRCVAPHRGRSRIREGREHGRRVERRLRDTACNALKRSASMTADVLRDYMLGRLSGTERQRVRDRLRVDPHLRGALRRLRNTTVRVRARLGRVDAVQQLPREWLTIVARVAPHKSAGEAKRPRTWLRSGTPQNDERALTWL
jgi:hypothetical protein